jgi:outer membrane protein TolC|tara:strand:+ start:2284 stop:2421 length:138 start_codon:yes stop_codon:yes gene_type:complete
MKKSTEKKRIDRMSKDAKRLFMHGLMTTAALERIEAALKAAKRKL